MGDISPELVERMVRAIHAYANGKPNLIQSDRSVYAELCALSDELPAPVDPDMIEAREVVCGYHHDKHLDSPWHREQAALVRSGRRDTMLDVQAAYHGIKRGRELAAQVQS